ncbi:MAG: LOG family protein [Deltaproteobacteria bacterium]|nr:LOG family protein [Deltaproteobacteria bacterium]
MPPPKAYNNYAFLNSDSARAIRILCEYEEPRDRFQRLGVDHTVVLFGSARALPGEVAALRASQAREEAARAARSEDRARAEEALARAEARVRLSRYYDDARVLARRLTRWSLDRPQGAPRYLVCSGGGPGVMEAANRGAADVEGGSSVGLGISLPFEERINQYATEALSFEFHYFFMRKYWFVSLAKALVAFPGGFGTFDELAEGLTLRQTGKAARSVPLVLYGSEYWQRVLDLDLMVEWGLISPEDLDLVHASDTVDEAFEYLVGRLEAQEREAVDASDEARAERRNG